MGLNKGASLMRLIASCKIAVEDVAREWSEAVAGLRRLSAGGEFALVLSGEGTFYLRLQAEDSGDEERSRVVESFEEWVRVRNGRRRILRRRIARRGRVCR